MRIRHSLWDELSTKLSGNVYADETELGADPQADLRTYHHRRNLKKQGKRYENTVPVFGLLGEGKASKKKPKKGVDAVEGGKLLLFAIDNKTMDTLQDLLCYGCDDWWNTQLYTDGHPSYKGMDWYFAKHYPLNRSEKGLYDYERYVRKVNEVTLRPASEEEIKTGACITLTTNPIENVWSHLQLDYRRLFGYSLQHRQLYLNEFMFRWNHMHLDDSELFMLLLKRCCETSLYERRLKKNGKIERCKVKTRYRFKLKPGWRKEC